MSKVIFCLALLFALPCASAWAGQNEARAVALASGCKPTKIDIVRQTFGTSAAVTYKIACENKVPPAAGSAAAQAPTVTVRCQGKLCTQF